MSPGGSEVERLRRRLERERTARGEAERIAEQTTSALYDRQRELELLQAVATAANDASSLEEVLRATIRGICAHLSWPVGHAWVTKAPTGKVVSSGIWHLDDPDTYAHFRRISEATVFAPGEGLPGATIAGAEPVWIEDVMRHLNFPRRHQLERGVVHGALGIPVLAGTDAVAMIEFFTDHPAKRDDAMLALAGQIGAHLGRVAERMRARDEISHQALHDALTGLPNRALLLDRLRLALGRSARSSAHTGVLFIDLDRFKFVNDSLGHAEGDRVLVEVAQRLIRALRPGDTIARLGGDEFVVLCEDLSDEREALGLAERLHLELLLPFELKGGEEHLITSSIGVALAPSDADPEDLLQNADAAMYRAKDLGGARHELFDEPMRDRVLQRLQTERSLQRALDGDQLRLHYQRLVSLADGSTCGVEALIRWDDPERGLIPPADFIPLAEESGLIVRIGSWVLSEACRQAAGWRAKLGDAAPLPVTVNLAARQLGQEDLHEEVQRVLEESGLAPTDLALEITETALMENTETPARTLAALRELGVRVLLDDFGTGYSSLSYLNRFPIDVIKIDRSFIAELALRPEGSAIVEAIVGMGHALSLQVVAEGIETEEQAREAERLGVDMGQGFLFARPVPAADLEARLLAAPQAEPAQQQ